MTFFISSASCGKRIVNGQLIQKVSNCKYLGILIDEDLKWTEHIDSIY